jgi:sarcosine oxidase gamma subunit
VRSVHFVRVLVCTKGWTGSQVAAVAAHNKRHPTQPILLAEATNSDSLFGVLSAEALVEHVGPPAPRKQATKGRADPDWVIPAQWAERQPEKASAKKKASAKRK